MSPRRGVNASSLDYIDEGGQVSQLEPANKHLIFQPKVLGFGGHPSILVNKN